MLSIILGTGEEKWTKSQNPCSHGQNEGKFEKSTIIVGDFITPVWNGEVKHLKNSKDLQCLNKKTSKLDLKYI